jgi:heme/copper-type cytochrome/quinol oxidase subunit 2
VALELRHQFLALQFNMRQVAVADHLVDMVTMAVALLLALVVLILLVFQFRQYIHQVPLQIQVLVAEVVAVLFHPYYQVQAGLAL